MKAMTGYCDEPAVDICGGTDLPYPPPYKLLDPNLVGDAVDVIENGRIQINLDSKLTRFLSKLTPNLPDPLRWEAPAVVNPVSWSVKLNIVIQIIGSRGDVQPFIALGNELQKYGHRVRQATHNVFSNFVRSHGLEFYPIGGDPQELMAYMVKNPGLIPNMAILREGDIQRKRSMLTEMLCGCWDSSVEPDPLSRRPFVADAIIANPPSFAHIHCAEALGIPVHLMFTMPWSNTRAFPHPLANLKNAGNDLTTANYISYSIFEWITWQGMGDIINNFRMKLDLELLSGIEGPNLASNLKVPITYCWSPALVPKPLDWPSHIDICGFFFRDPPNYTAPSDLDASLRAGPPPVYIGFGSIVIDNPAAMGSIILKAVRRCGIRAIISRGWSKLGGPEFENVFYLGDCPHEWLFQHVAAVVHHGGAGTTACGLLNGRPTAIVPFFGDQPFWGNMVAAAGAGPKPIPHKSLTAERLVEAISFCLTAQAVSSAREISKKMSGETGVQAAVRSFHANLPIESLKCDILPDQPAVWTYNKKNKSIKLSKLAAEVLIEYLRFDPSRLELYETRPVLIERHYSDPVTSTIHAFMTTQKDVVEAAGGIFYKPYKEYRSAHALQSSNQEVPPSFNPAMSKNKEYNGEGSSRQLSRDQRADGHSVAGAMAAASAKSLGNLYVKAFKGLAVDIPLATAEGLRNIPALYGEKVRDNGSVTDWKSGAVVGGRSFLYGMSEGLTDIFVQPYKGAKEGGALGAVKGVGKGTAALATKTTSAVLGLVAYPGQGICKTIRTAVKSHTRKHITAVKHIEGQYLLNSANELDLDHTRILADFDDFMGEHSIRS